MDLTSATDVEVLGEVSRRMSGTRTVDPSKGGLMPTDPFVNQAPIIAPVQQSEVKYLRYQFLPSDTRNLSDGTQTNPAFLSTKHDAEVIAKEVGGGDPYLSPGLTDIGPSKRQVWLVDIPGYPHGSILASALIAEKFNYYTLDATGSMMAAPGKWVGNNWRLNDPTISAWGNNAPGTVNAS